jgi:hypothetical protein
MVIGEEAFCFCQSLIDGLQCVRVSTITIPASVEVIEQHAFYRSVLLIEVTFERQSHLKRFGGFQRCIALLRIVIPQSTEFIHQKAFF